MHCFTISWRLFLLSCEKTTTTTSRFNYTQTSRLPLRANGLSNCFSGHYILGLSVTCNLTPKRDQSGHCWNFIWSLKKALKQTAFFQCNLKSTLKAKSSGILSWTPKETKTKIHDLQPYTRWQACLTFSNGNPPFPGNALNQQSKSVSCDKMIDLPVHLSNPGD